MSSTGTNTTMQKFEAPAYTLDGNGLGPGTTWQEYIARGGDIANKYATDPSLIYGNSANQPMVAQMSQLQNTAGNGIYGMASQGGQNEGRSNAYLDKMLNGEFQNVQPSNPYMGNSPQFQSMLDATNQDITKNYQNGIGVQTDAQAARQGAFGGSAYNEMVQNNQSGLAKAIAQNTDQQRNAQFERSAGMAESEIGRSWQGYENAAGRGLQAVAGVQQQGNTDLQRWLATMGVGDLQRDVESENIAAAKDLFGQNVQQPLQALDIFGNVLGRASGQGGTSTSTQFGSGMSGIANGVGGLAALSGLFGK